MTNPQDLINWAELSRTLAGGKASITREKIPKKHQKKIQALIDYCEDWINKYKKPPEL